jgi:hypothetical protein
VAGLTLLRAFLLAGSPDLPPVGSFEDWAIVRGAVWVGWRSRRDSDHDLGRRPAAQRASRLLELWHAALGKGEWALADLHKELGKAPLAPRRNSSEFLEEMCGRGGWNGRSLGWRLRRVQDRPLGAPVLGQEVRPGRESSGG